MKLRDDPDAASSMAAVLTQSNSFKLTGKIGRRPTDGELYMAHFMGVGGAAKLISNAEDNPNASGARLFPNAAAANRSIFYERSRTRAQRLRSLFGADLALCRRRQFTGDAHRDGVGRRHADAVAFASAAGPAADRQCRLSLELSGCALGHAGHGGIARTRRPPSTDPIFRSLFQAGERTQPVSPAVQELWGNSSSLTSVPRRRRIGNARSPRAASARSLQRPQRHLQWLVAAPASVHGAAAVHPGVGQRELRTLNKTSIKPTVYGERFVKRHGLFSVDSGIASRCRFKLRKPAGP